MRLSGLVLLNLFGVYYTGVLKKKIQQNTTDIVTTSEKLRNYIINDLLLTSLALCFCVEVSAWHTRHQDMARQMAELPGRWGSSRYGKVCEMTP